MLRITVLFFTLLTILGCQTSAPKVSQEVKNKLDLISFSRLRIDTLFDSNQIICLLSVDKDNMDKVNFNIYQNQPDLIPTSEFAQQHGALAAINGGFFDMSNGGSISYLEVADSTLATSKNNILFNGAIVLADEAEMSIEPTEPDSMYSNSHKESAVLVTGPLLLMDKFKTELPNQNLVTERHPRTCLCETKTSFLFVTVDGRTLEAAGMTLMELQDFLLSQECINAINLDGGGSTTMWVKSKGVVNYPSDITGERPVANVLAIEVQ